VYKRQVSDIPDKEKPKVFFEWRGKDHGRQTGNKNAAFYPMCKKAGGIDIAADLPVLFPVVDLEWILERNPDVIVGNSYGGGYETDDESELKAHYDEIIELPGFDNVTAVKDNRVYILNNRMFCGPSYIVGLSYLAKWFHPHLFEDLNPQEIHQEYIDKFCGIDFDVSKHGVFVYPPQAG